MMELRIISPSEDGFVKEIKWNYEELKAQVAAMMSEYEGLVLTEDQIASGRKDRANLNKLLTAMEDERKRLKNLCMEPYNRFEAQLKEVEDLVRKPINLLDGQIKDFEAEQRNAKISQIQDYYDEHIGTLKGILPFDRVLKKEYGNKTYNIENAYNEISALIDRVNSDLDTIENLGSPYDNQIRDVYLRTLDLSKALQEKARLEEQDKRMAARKAEQERLMKERNEQIEQERQKAQREAEARRAEEEARKQAEAAQSPVQEVQPAPEPMKEKIYMVRLDIFGTRADLTRLQHIMEDNHIQFKTIEKAQEVK